MGLTVLSPALMAPEPTPLSPQAQAVYDAADEANAGRFSPEDVTAVVMQNFPQLGDTAAVGVARFAMTYRRTNSVGASL